MQRAGAVVAAILVAALAATPRASDDVTTKQVVEAATKYVKTYETALAMVLGDERTEQTASWQDPKSTRRASQSRSTSGEIFLTFLPTDAVWIAVHDVSNVDGTPVVDRDRLIDLMQRAPISSVARDVANRNARFNVGHITRNFNEPTLALLLFDEKRVTGVHFSKPVVSRTSGGGTVAAIEFEERDRPTLVESPVKGPIYSKGRFTIDVATGRIERSEIHFDAGAIQAELTTTYRDNEKLTLWLPAEFTERYTAKTAREQIDCTSTYSNYKRFETVVEMKIK